MLFFFSVETTLEWLKLQVFDSINFDRETWRHLGDTIQPRSFELGLTASLYFGEKNQSIKSFWSHLVVSTCV